MPADTAAGPAGLAAVSFYRAPVAMAVTGLDGRFLLVNDALRALVGLPETVLTSMRLDDVCDSAGREAVRAGRAQLLAFDPGRWRERVQLRRGDGREVAVQITCVLVRDGQGRALHLLVAADDVTAQQQAQAQLTHTGLHDPLTGLPNRVLLTDRLQRALARLARAPDPPVAVLHIGLDGTQQLNDRCGHAAGDKVLLAFTARLARLLRPGDTAARLGGEEFLILCQDAGHAEAASVAERITQALTVPFDAGGGCAPARLTTSVGIAVTNDPGVTADELLRTAAQTMNQAKHHTR